MRRQSYKSYLFLVLLLFVFLSLPQENTCRLRSIAVASINPPWQFFHFLKTSAFKLLMIAPPAQISQKLDQETELNYLKAENLNLKQQIENMREYLLFEDRIDLQLEKLKSLGKQVSNEPAWKEFFKRRSQELSFALELQIQSLPAKVVFREPGSYSHVLWLGVGEKDNKALGAAIVAVNSPVVIGTSIVGVVEHVEYGKCKVRLITDPRLAASVRAVRGFKQNVYLLDRLEEIISAIESRDDLFSTVEMRNIILKNFHFLKTSLSTKTPDRFLAKGELHGAAAPLWRSCAPTLKGIGFNYDFPDIEGREMDLSKGEILKTGDLLITTGYDGIFPPGFEVGIVSKIEKLREGACSYELEARLTAGNLEELSHVLVLPPQAVDFKKD